MARRRTEKAEQLGARIPHMRELRELLRAVPLDAEATHPAFVALLEYWFDMPYHARRYVTIHATPTRSGWLVGSVRDVLVAIAAVAGEDALSCRHTRVRVVDGVPTPWLACDPRLVLNERLPPEMAEIAARARQEHHEWREQARQQQEAAS